MIVVTHPIDTEKLNAWRQACGERDWPQYYVVPAKRRKLAKLCQSTNHAELSDNCLAEKHEAQP